MGKTPDKPGKESPFQNPPRLQPKAVLTVTGNENWEEMTGFGKDAAMAEMMTLMMVGGSGMEHMKMGAMKSGKPKEGTPAATGQAEGWQVVLNTKADMLTVGKNTLDVTIMDPAGKPVTGAKVSSAVEMTSMDMGVKRPLAKEGEAGHYLTDVEFSMKGPWRVTLTVIPPNQKPFTKALEFKISK
ncbi:MAG TPA: FixH family protein [Chthonomonadaceae bacterium]|nr:FixH family protein [Chthonomonadaceae bacterium]